MGKSQSKHDQTFDPNQWQQISDSKNDYDGQYIVVRNRITGQLLDRYQLQFPNEKQFNRYMDSVYYRRDQDNIVRVVHYEPKIFKEFCGSSYMLYVYLEHCKSRLSQFQDIPSPDSLYVALAMLEGYQKLYKKVGRFYISQNQIMIDESGKIRVWLNSDFSQNQAQDLKPNTNTISNKSQEYNMVNDIINIVFENSDDSDDPYDIKFRDFYERERISHDQRVGFGQARNIIYQYARMNGIEIPEVFTSVLNIYEQDNDMNDLRPDQDLMPKKQMLDEEYEERLGNVNYQAINSVVNHNQPQALPGPLISQGSGTFVRDNSHPSFTRPPYGTIINSLQKPTIVVNRPGPMVNQMSSRTVYPISPSMPVTRVVNPAPIQQIHYPPPITQPPISNYAFTIRPNNIASNVTINRASAPISHSPIKIPPPIYGPVPTYAPNNILIRNPAPVPVPVNTFIPVYNPIMVPTEGVRRVQSKPQPKRKISLGEQQLEIEKNLILKNNANSDQYINQANIIRDLSELHKIQQEQKSKRSNLEEDNSRNASEDIHRKEHQIRMAQHYDQLSEEIIKENQRSESANNRKNSGGQYQGRYERFEEEQNLFKEENAYNGKQIYQPISTTANNNFVSQMMQTGQKVTFKNQTNTNTVFVQPPQQPIWQLPQLQTYDSYNSIYSNKALTSALNSQSKRQIYYTLQNQIQLDPQIANDLALYAQS